jgi:hypothetical protein
MRSSIQGPGLIFVALGGENCPERPHVLDQNLMNYLNPAKADAKNKI